MSTQATNSDEYGVGRRSEGAGFDKTGSYFALGSVGRISSGQAAKAQQNLASFATEQPGDPAEKAAWLRDTLEALGLRQCTGCERC